MQHWEIWSYNNHFVAPSDSSKYKEINGKVLNNYELYEPKQSMPIA